MNILSMAGSSSFVIAKQRQGAWDVFHARPGSSRKEAWAHATDAAKTTKKEFVVNGWVSRRIYLEVEQSS